MFDVIVIAVVALSTAFAAFRGGLRELSTIAALAGAGGLTYLTAQPVMAAAGLTDSFFGAIAVVVVLVAAFFLIGHVALHLLLRRTPLEGRARLADRVGGGVFGLARGLALVGLAYLGYSYYLDETQQPEFVKSAVTRPIASGVAHWFETFAPETAHIEGAAVPSAEENAAVQGYNRGDRNGLQEIVTTVTTTDPAAQDSGAEPAPSQEDAEKDDIADILSEDDN